MRVTGRSSRDNGGPSRQGLVRRDLGPAHKVNAAKRVQRQLERLNPFVRSGRDEDLDAIVALQVRVHCASDDLAMDVFRVGDPALVPSVETDRNHSELRRVPAPPGSMRGKEFDERRLRRVAARPE